MRKWFVEIHGQANYLRETIMTSEVLDAYLKAHTTQHAEIAVQHMRQGLSIPLPLTIIATPIR
jgi:hypothetical protein